MKDSLLAAIYCRLSEEDKNKTSGKSESRSIENQKSLLLRYASEQNWEVFRIYSDDDYAGADRRRPAFQQLLTDAQNHCFDIILCKSQSRFTRELELVEKYIHGLFPAWGIRFVSVADNADTANEGNKKARQINGLVNEWYLEDMSANIKSVLTDRRKKGLHIGAFALYGYKKDPNHKGRLLIDPDAAAIVREVFTLYAKGYGKTAIARLLNDRGIPNPTEYKRRQGLRYKQPKTGASSLWSYSAISHMLSNEIYIGNMVQGKYGSVSYKTKQNRPRPKEQWYRVENTHDPVIDKTLWEQVQKLRAQNTKPFSSGTTGVFAGKVRCMYCGYTMRSSKHKNGRRYFMCSRRHLSKNACAGSFLSSARLEETVLSQFQQLTEQLLNKEQLPRNIISRENIASSQKHLKNALALYEKKETEYTRALQELYLDKARGVLSDSDFSELSKDFIQKRLSLRHWISEIQNQLSALSGSSFAENSEPMFSRCMDLKHLDREIVDIFIDYILIGKKDPASREVPVEIHWNF